MDIPIKPFTPEQQRQFVSPPIHARRGLMTILTIVVLIAIVVGGYAFYRHYFHPTKVTTGHTINPQSLANGGNLDAALVQLNQILASKSSDFIKARAGTIASLTLSQKGLATFKEAEYGAQAATAANDAIALLATSSEAYRALGLADQIQQKYAEAHAAYEKSAVLDPKNSFALSGDAQTYELEGNISKAGALYKAALVLYVNNYEADFGLGRIAAAKGDIAGALAYFQSISQINQNMHESAQAEYYMAMLSIAKYPTTLSVAQAQLQQSVAHDPSYLSAWLGLGTVFSMEAGTKKNSADQQASFLSQSLGALDKAVLLTSFDSTKPAAHPVAALDLSVVGDTQPVLAALAAYTTAVSSEISLSDTDKADRLKRAAALTAFIKAESPATTSK